MVGMLDKWGKGFNKKTCCAENKVVAGEAVATQAIKKRRKVKKLSPKPEHTRNTPKPHSTCSLLQCCELLFIAVFIFLAVMVLVMCFCVQVTLCGFYVCAMLY